MEDTPISCPHCWYIGCLWWVFGKKLWLIITKVLWYSHIIGEIYVMYLSCYQIRCSCVTISQYLLFNSGSWVTQPYRMHIIRDIDMMRGHLMWILCCRILFWHAPTTGTIINILFDTVFITVIIYQEWMDRLQIFIHWKARVRSISNRQCHRIMFLVRFFHTLNIKEPFLYSQATVPNGFQGICLSKSLLKIW